MSDFVTEYVSLMSGLNDASVRFHEASALYALSVSVGTRWTFDSTADRSVFLDEEAESWGRSLSVWFMLLGKTRISRKTSAVITPVEDILQNLQTFKLSDAFTKQRIISLLHQYKEEAGLSTIEAAFILDECSLFFEGLIKTDYLSGMDAFLSRIYDGKPCSQSTNKRGDEAIPRNHIPLLFASTLDLPTRFKDRMFHQGFLNRFCFVIPTEKRNSKPIQSRNFTKKEITKRNFINQFLLSIKGVRGISFVLASGSEAEDLYLEFETKIDQRISEETLDLAEGYWGNLPNILIRISCLYHISKMTIEEIQDLLVPTILVLTEEDLQRGIEYLESQIWPGFQEMIKLKRTKSEESKLPTSRYDLERFMDVALAKDDLVTVGEISATLFLPKKKDIMGIMLMGVDRKWLRTLTPEDLNSDEKERFRPNAGPFPKVFKVTKLGKTARR